MNLACLVNTAFFLILAPSVTLATASDYSGGGKASGLSGMVCLGPNLAKANHPDWKKRLFVTFFGDRRDPKTGAFPYLHTERAFFQALDSYLIRRRCRYLQDGSFNVLAPYIP